MKRPSRFDPRGWLGSVLVVVAAIGIATFDMGSAAPTAQTVNVGNVITAASVLPPTNVAAAMTLETPPVQIPVVPPYCTANISWTASGTPGVTGTRFDGSWQGPTRRSMHRGPWSARPRQPRQRTPRFRSCCS